LKFVSFVSNSVFN